LPRGRSTTVGGLVVEWAGRIPNPGERFLVRGLEIDIVEASPTRIERLIIRSSETPTSSLAVGPA
jgi:CBS domain containing-hemolysin-like protein